MAQWDKFFEQAPKIIAEAAKKPLGIVALIILALSALGITFFSDSPDPVKIAMFALLVFSFGLFGFAAMRRMPEKQKEVETLERPAAEAATSTLTPKEAETPSGDAAQAPEQEETAAVPPDDISIGQLPITGAHLFGREAELTRLDQAWADPETNVISLVAWGGVG